MDQYKKMEIKEDGKYECGGELDADHLFACPLLSIKCRKEDLRVEDDNRHFRQDNTKCMIIGKGIRSRRR